jgi:CspA family cold shock protein
MALFVQEINRKSDVSIPINKTSKSNEDSSRSKKELELIEIVGHIKWFNGVKRYGFIVSEKSGEDILIHVTTLRAFGYSTVSEGTKIVCEAIQGQRGLQAFRILAIDESTALYPAENPRARTRANVVPTSEWVHATVKWFNRLRGFGFLTLGPDTPDIFVHMETLRTNGILSLQPDEEILVRYGKSPNGLMATEVQFPE